MIFSQTTLKDAWLIDLQPRGDERGMFARTFCRDEFAAHGMETVFVQQNMSFTPQKGSVRGLHFQRQPHAEVKVMRCVRGAILDVIVDLRPDSPSYLRHEGFELTAENRRELYVPRGFAHGFMSLTDDAEISYLVSAPYTPAAESGLRHDDPKLAIAWPLEVTSISDKDRAWPLLTDAPPII